jgi:transposase InsO family protein
MYEDIRTHVRICDTCQRRRKEKEIEPLQPVKVTTAFAHIGIDIIGPLPRTLRGNRYIIMAIDYLTKYPEARALQLADSLSIVPFIYEDIICRHGIPLEITSDRGTEFVNELVRTLCQQYKIRHIITTAYHPQGNGLTERVNQTVKNTLAKSVQSQGGDWDLYLPSALFAIRTMKQETTKFTPFELTYGRKAKQPADQIIEETLSKKPLEERLSHRITIEIQELHTIRNKAAGFIAVAQDRQKKNYDLTNKEVTRLAIGDKVLLYRNIVESSWSAKLEPKWDGPYHIASIKDTTYKLRKMTGTLLPFTVHRNRLKKYQDAPIQQ